VQTTVGGPGGSGRDSGIVDALANPVPSAKADPVDGTRLKAEYRVAADGSKEYLAGVWYDSQRSEDCAFATAGDGQQRCIPDGAAASVFADSMCTKPIVALAAGCSAPTYVLTAGNATCSATPATHVFAVGAATTPVTLYVPNGSSCFPAGPPGSGFTYYGVGDEVAATQFVAATKAHD
jgi:hypothetical protein